MKSIFTTLATAASVATLSSACSDFLLNATSPDNILSGRTMDFEADLKTVVEVIPANTSFQELPVFNCVECSDYQWKNKYGFVAFNMFGMNVASDGLNERGLSAAWLYLTATEYPSPQSTPDNVKDPSKPIITSVVSYLLGNYASVDEVRAGLDTFQIAEFDERIEVPLLHDTSLGRVPLHVSVHDAFGKSLVIEFIKGQTKIYDNINDVLTNDPPLDEQLNALLANGYSNIPGGYGSVERFLRVSVLNHAVQSGYSNAVVGKTSYTIGTDEQRAVSDVVHILNTVIRPPLTEATEWNVVRDHKRRKLYIQSTQNMVLRLIDLNQLNFAEGVENRKYIPITYGDWFVDVTSALKSPYNTAKTIDLPPRTQLEQLLEQILHGGIPPATQSLSAEHHSASSSSTASFALGMLSGVAVAVVVMSLSQVVMRARRRGAYMRIPEPDEVRV